MEFSAAVATPSSSLRRLAITAFDFSVSLPLMLVGALVFVISGRTPNLSYHAMRRLHGITDGGINRVWLRLARLWRPADPAADVRGFAGEFSASQIGAMAEELRERGIAIFDRQLPAALCDELLAFARTANCRPMGGATPAPYPGERSHALRYDFSENDILGCPAACRIALDGTLFALADAYFGCRARYDFTAMWWTTRTGPRDLSKAAQMFHYDMDRPFFIKFFIYLTDVGPDNGPHVFVPGSHVSKPASVRPPTRYTDEQVVAAFGVDGIQTICAPRGTIFAVDTSALHKGLPVVDGDRLALQVEFAISLFGQNYPRPRLSREMLRDAGVEAPDATRFSGKIV